MVYILRRFAGPQNSRLNAVIDQLEGHLNRRINLIGSATLPLPDVCQASAIPGSAVRVEGHRDTRYFPGTEAMDETEAIVEDAVSVLFGLTDDYEVSAQPHAATQANHAVWRAFLCPGDLVFGLALEDGGHISHILSLPDGVTFEPIPLQTSGGIDYGALHSACISRGPKAIIAGGSSYPLGINYQRLSQTAKACGAYLHADLAHSAAHVAAGAHPPAAPYADTIAIDASKTLRGSKGGVLAFRSKYRMEVRRAIFPLEQSSPNQSGLFAKAALFNYWLNNDLSAYAYKLTRDAQLFQDALVQAGIQAPFAETQSHIVLVDVTPTGLSGRDAEEKLAKFNILVNRNTIPGDTKKPWLASGLRFGVTTLTILEYEPDEILALAVAVADILFDRGNPGPLIDTLLAKRHGQIATSCDPSIASG